jgi:hypothetical protein
MKRAVILSAVALALWSGLGRAANADVSVFVGYADGLRGGGFFPSPWDGDAGVHFLGGSGGGSYDAGAFRIDNTGASDVVIAPGVKVDGFGAGGPFQIWDGMLGSGLTLHPGEIAIFTQTADFNFDTSDAVAGTCGAGDGAIPVIHVNVDGTDVSFADSGQVLNTHGFDWAACVGNESFRWRPVGGGGQPGDTPEPGTLSLLGGSILGLGSLVLRSRRGK